MAEPNDETIKTVLEAHIATWEKEKVAIEEAIKKARDVLWAMHTVATAFKCGKGLPAHGAICPGCERATPTFWEHNRKFSYPGGVQSDTFTAEDGQNRDCRAWQQKRVVAICGCYGTYKCECGYEESVCRPIDNKICPFCGRVPGFTESGLFRWTRESGQFRPVTLEGA